MYSVPRNTWGSATSTSGRCGGRPKKDIFRFRQRENLLPVYKMIDTCASEFESYVPYFYSTYEEENESIVSGKKKIVVLGSGPIRIGQGIEFDYSTVHAIWTIQAAGVRSDYHQQQSRDRLHRLHHLGQAVLRAADRGRRDEHPDAGGARGRGSEPWRADRHQPGGAAACHGRQDHRHGRGSHHARREPRLL